MKTFTLTLLTVLTFAVPALARPNRGVPHVPVAKQVVQDFERRQNAQLDRIFKGLSDGTLTWAEGNRLLKAQQRIETTAERALSDGLLFPVEMRKIDAMLDRQAFQIVALRENRAFRFLRAAQLQRPTPAPVVVRYNKPLPRYAVR